MCHKKTVMCLWQLASNLSHTSATFVSWNWPLDPSKPWRIFFFSSDGREQAFGKSDHSAAAQKQTSSYVSGQHRSTRKWLSSPGFTFACYTTCWCCVFLWSSCLSFHLQEWKKNILGQVPKISPPLKIPISPWTLMLPCATCYFRSQACRGRATPWPVISLIPQLQHPPSIQQSAKPGQPYLTSESDRLPSARNEDRGASQTDKHPVPANAPQMPPALKHVKTWVTPTTAQQTQHYTLVNLTRVFHEYCLLFGRNLTNSLFPFQNELVFFQKPWN